LGRLRKLVISVLVAMMMASFMWPVYLDHTYAYTMPTSPRPDQGRIYRMVVNHGSVIYVNEKEFRQADLVFHKISLIGIVCLGLAGIALVYWNPRADGLDAK
jgi:hypothetical protein